MKIKLITVLFAVMLFQPFLTFAQLSSKIVREYPAYVVYRLNDLNSTINLPEEKIIKIAQKLVLSDSLANESLKKGGSIAQLKLYYIIDKNFLKPILSPEELDHYGYALDNENRYLAALKFATTLNMESAQISEIRKQNDSLSRISKLPAKETIEIYTKGLTGILKKEQYVALLKIIYQAQSEEETKKDWEKIIKLDLVADKKDRKEYIKILNYHIVKNAFLDKKADRYEKPKRDLLAKKMALGEPPILTHANILSEGTYISNKYSAIIKYEKELELSANQVDSLLLKYKELEKTKLENKEKEATGDAIASLPSEYENIAKILTPEQVKKWLIKKNKLLAKSEALKNWQKLEQEGLAKGLDKEQTVTDFTVYQLQFLVTKDKAMVYHTQENIFMKKEIEKRKPELLKQLDMISLKKSKSVKTKKELTW